MTQAVMLAGGRGTRLAPHTDHVPKLLVNVAGKPFLNHLVTSLTQQGITELLILAGYRSPQVVEAAKDLDEGIHISVIEGDIEWSTGERLLRARDLLRDRFLLLYTDNLTVFRMSRLSDIAQSTNARVVFSACRNCRGNLIRDPESSTHVAGYLPDRSRGNADWVEVGFTLIERDYLLSMLEQTGGSLPDAFAAAAADGSVSADFLPYPYHSIGDPARLEATRKTLEPRRLLLVDRDGLINKRPPQACYIQSINDVTLLDANVEALSLLGRAGFSFVIVTNQAGIGRGIVTAEAVKQVNDFIVKKLARAGVNVVAVYVCPHSWDAGCDCRKPKPGMLTQAARELGLYLPKIVFMGDDERDVEAGNAAGAETVLITEHTDGNKVTPSLGAFRDVQAALPALRAAYNIN